MPNNLNIEQLKEFFEFRASAQDEKIKNIETSIDNIGNIVNSVAVKVNIIWGAIGILATTVVTGMFNYLK